MCVNILPRETVPLPFCVKARFSQSLKNSSSLETELKSVKCGLSMTALIRMEGVAPVAVGVNLASNCQLH